MNDTIAQLFVWFLTALIIALVIQALLSWFPNAQRSAPAQMLYRVTSPIIDPIRRVMPRTGMFDFSTMVAILLLYLMINVVERAADA